MNLKEVYEIFYPRKESKQISVWNIKPIYRSKKEFYELLFPMELRWLNIKLWNDKARRSRFLSDCMKESGYVIDLRNEILNYPLMIPRIEEKASQILTEGVSYDAMNRVFFGIMEKEKIELSPRIRQHLLAETEGQITKEIGRILSYLTLYAIFHKEVNQLYRAYLYKKENGLVEKEVQGKRDELRFQSEYPPDMSVYEAGEWITHTWIVKNVGEIAWRNRYIQCESTPFPIQEECAIVKLPEIVYPGENAALTVRFRAPDKPGAYMMSWKLMNDEGKIVYPGRRGLGLHFTIEKEVKITKSAAESNYRVVQETPSIPTTLEAGKLYTHMWVIENTGATVWKDYYCECINEESIGYAKNELRKPLLQVVKPGERMTIKVEFVTPPIEGVYRMIFRIVKKDGTLAFPKGRQLEILVNLT